MSTRHKLHPPPLYWGLGRNLTHGCLIRIWLAVFLRVNWSFNKWFFTVPVSVLIVVYDCRIKHWNNYTRNGGNRTFLWLKWLLFTFNFFVFLFIFFTTFDCSLVQCKYTPGIHLLISSLFYHIMPQPPVQGHNVASFITAGQDANCCSNKRFPVIWISFK